MRTRLTASVTLAAAALLLTACGGGPLDDKTGPEVSAAAADALEAAGSFHLSGTVSRGGQASEVDLHLQGEDATGTLRLDGSELQLLGVGGEVYVQAAPEFWTAFGMSTDVAAQLEGQWVTVPAEAAAGFQPFSVAGFVEELRNPDEAVKDEVTATEVDGDDAVVVALEDGSTLTVLNDDPSYPVELTNDEGDSSGKVTISRIGEEEEITAPSDPVDLAELTGAA